MSSKLIVLDANILIRAVLGNCPIWTEDQDFFGTGVSTWTTDRVHLFFEESTR